MVGELRHLSIIMDGNGRWSQNLGKIRSFGHEKGSENIKNAVSFCLEYGIKELSLFAFSTENFNRSKFEVNFLFSLFKKFLKNRFEYCKKYNIRFKWVGLKNNLDDEMLHLIEKLEQKTCEFDALTVAIVFNYGGKSDILNSISTLLKKQLDSSNMDLIEKEFQKNLLTYPLSEPDLVIRTGGQTRISNFFLWQIAYSELYFVDKYWPDFSKDDFIKAYDFFIKIKRNFGGV